MGEWWLKPVNSLKGIGTAKTKALNKLGVFTSGDVLEMYPYADKYQDRTKFKVIRELQDGELDMFQAQVVDSIENRPRRGMVINKLIVRDETGQAEIVWFNQSFLVRKYQRGMNLLIYGKVQRRFGIQIHKAEIDIINGSALTHTNCIMPIYPLTDNLTQNFMRSLVKQVLQIGHDIQETLPECIVEEYGLIDRCSAINNIHFPQDNIKLAKARHRLVFEELYMLQCGLLYVKQQNKNDSGIKHSRDGELSIRVFKSLPFNLTKDQVKVLNEIKQDMEDKTPMQRLVQGDVGSGKTVIAALALVKTVENGFQGAMMVPTEILADQHYHTLAKLLSSYGIRTVLLKGSLTKKVREEVLDRIKNGLIDIVVGTHALIQEDVVFNNLGLVITDEQHRFGVRQRALLQAKGNYPDVLVMTATPIPRTMALTIYGDLDVSVIRELPPGRKPIKTVRYASSRRKEIYEGVLRQMALGRQAYVVCPLVEESEHIATESAVETYEMLKNSFLKEISCGLVHGKMSQQDKENVMGEFINGNIKVLVSTTVIEVGVNVPNATVMIIEGADRFGLAQLHQLRGRIGRGEHESFCVLISDSQNPETLQRLDFMTKYSDGFILAEKDLAIRGPGQFFGIKQHGLPDLKLADVFKDIDILLEARQAAMKTVSSSELLSVVKKRLREHFNNRFQMIFYN